LRKAYATAPRHTTCVDATLNSQALGVAALFAKTQDAKSGSNFENFLFLSRTAIILF